MGWYVCRPSNGVGQEPEAAAYLNITCKLNNNDELSYVYLILVSVSKDAWGLNFSQ